MKTVFMEPLNISKELLDILSAPLRDGNNTFTAYDTKPATLEEWIARLGDADQLILANTPMPEAVLDAAPNLKYINIALPARITCPWRKPKPKAFRSSTPPATLTKALLSLSSA